MASGERVNLSQLSGRKAIRTRPSNDNSDKSSACTRQTAQQRVVIVYLKPVLIFWLTIGVFSIAHWRYDYNHGPLISLLGPRQRLPLSIKASAMIRLNSIAVIKTPLLIYPIQQRENQPWHNTRSHDSTDHQHNLCPLSSTRHSPAFFSPYKKSALHDCNRHSPALSWA
jgi:hypothetical protein